MITSAFTCTGPYAILIMLGIKRVENRNMRPVPEKGRCAISCSKSFCREEFGNFVQWASVALSPDEFGLIPAWSDVRDWPGKVIGVCDYEVSETSDDGKWNEGYRYWWKLSNVTSFDLPIPCRGNTGMWEMPADLAAQVTVADQLAGIEGTKISTREDAERCFRAAVHVVGRQEGLFVLPLDADDYAISAPMLVAMGTDSTTAAVNPSEVFGVAMRAGASSIVLAHNHPSGNLTPSVQDKRLTDELRDLGDRLGVKLVDHIII